MPRSTVAEVLSSKSPEGLNRSGGCPTTSPLLSPSRVCRVVRYPGRRCWGISRWQVPNNVALKIAFQGSGGRGVCRMVGHRRVCRGSRISRATLLGHFEVASAQQRGPQNRLPGIGAGATRPLCTSAGLVVGETYCEKREQHRSIHTSRRRPGRHSSAGGKRTARASGRGCPVAE
jgi:hypothetical protein